MKKQIHPLRLLLAKRVFGICMLLGLVVIPAGYALGFFSIETVNMLGRYMTFAIVAVGLDLLWGYTGILSLCQASFFSLGAYAMGIYLAHHGGPEGITDRLGWKMPACLFVVYPYQVGEVPEDAMVPWFWKPFFNLPLTLLLGFLIPGLAALVIGFFGFRSRVRGVYFAILTQAIAVAVFLFFQRNEVKFGGTNGLTRFDRIGAAQSISSLGPSNLLENGHFRNDAKGWSVEGVGKWKYREGFVFEPTAGFEVQQMLKHPLKEGAEYCALFDIKGGGTSSDFAFEALLLDDSGVETKKLELRPVKLRGTEWTEYRSDFTVEDGAIQIQIAGTADVPASLTLSNVRLFERYVSGVGGWALTSVNVQLGLYLLTVLALGATYLCCRWIVGSRFGRVLLAVRDDETTLRFLGYQPWVYKLGAFVAAAMFAGLGGLLYVPQMKIITPYDMEPARSILVVIWVAVGGRGTLGGAVLGALCINLFYDYFTSEHDYGLFVWKAEYWQFILGALFVGVVLLFPQGLIRIWETVSGKKSER